LGASLWAAQKRKNKKSISVPKFFRANVKVICAVYSRKLQRIAELGLKKVSCKVFPFPDLPLIPACLTSSLNSSLDTYIEESHFGFKLISSDLLMLQPGSRILEVGSGIGLLARHIARQGFEVVALEPSAEGFEFMEKLQEHISAVPEFMTLKNFSQDSNAIEGYTQVNKFDYIFSINVLEHVKDVEIATNAMLNLLNPCGHLRIICPNYSFPYEGHFNIPYLLNPKFTFKIFSKRILAYNCEDPLGLWASINGIKLKKLSRIIQGNSRVVDFSFTRIAFEHYINRAATDKSFIRRKGQTLILVARKLFVFGKLLPKKYSPVIDCNIYV
jgi:2-polyprenyl-3-methyl-5-hydroxy-6-metoxy-1,4-benzoquinol methylase